MVEELRKKALKSLKWKLVICAIIIAVILVVTKCSIIDYIKGPIQLTADEKWDVKDLEGKYVTIDVDFVNLGFAEETSTNTKTNITTVTSNAYICECFDDECKVDILYAVKADKSLSNKLEAVYDENAETYGERASQSVKVTGTFTKMKDKLLSLYDDAIEDCFGTETLDFAVPYCIYTDTIAGMEMFMFYILYIIVLCCLVGMVISTVNYLRGSYDKYIKKFLAKNLNENMQGVEADYQSATEFTNYYKVGQKYFFYSKGNTMSMITLADQVWAYYFRRTGRNSVSQILFFNVNQKQTAVNISRELANEILVHLETQCPHMVIGYDADLQQTFKRDFNSFLNIKYNASRSAATQETQESQWNF